MRKLVMCLMLLILAAPSFGQRPKFLAEQQQVWDREEEYWRCVKTRDAAGYVALWDERFVGWPYRNVEPIGKEEIRSNTFPQLEDGTLQSIEVEPKAVQVFGDVAVVHYKVFTPYVLQDGGKEIRTARITHTWRRTNGVWLIIGGMSALVSPAS